MTTQTTNPIVTVKILDYSTGPAGKVADAELHFSDAAGPLAGLKLIGFGIWQRRAGTGLNVTFPARQYAVNGERRSFALLRPLIDATAQDQIRDVIIKAYTDQLAPAPAPATTDDPIVALALPATPPTGDTTTDVLF